VNWTGQEKFDCYCGRPAFVKVNGEGVPEMICFLSPR
jgi:peptide methionine sulfoxide reductase MsrB